MVQRLYIVKTSSMQWIQRCQKRDEFPRRAKLKANEVVTGIFRLFANDAANTEFIKSQYSSYNYTNSCNDGGKMKKILVVLLMHVSINVSILAQSVSSRSMALCDIHHLLHEEFNTLDYASSMQVPS